jgi:hypothetical protein
VGSDLVHAVVPIAGAHQGQTVRAEPVAVFQRAHAVFVHRPRLPTHLRQVEVLFLVRPQHRGVEERHRLIEQGGVASRSHVMVHHERKEEQVVGDTGADADAGGRMPPVLHVPLLELPRRRPQDLGPRFTRAAVDQSHDVLQLVAKAVGPARLVECRAAPDSTAQYLIKEPAIDHQVDARVGRYYLDDAQDPLPETLDLR